MKKKRLLIILSCVAAVIALSALAVVIVLNVGDGDEVTDGTEQTTEALEGGTDTAEDSTEEEDTGEMLSPLPSPPPDSDWFSADGGAVSGGGLGLKEEQGGFGALGTLPQRPLSPIDADWFSANSEVLGSDSLVLGNDGESFGGASVLPDKPDIDDDGYFEGDSENIGTGGLTPDIDDGNFGSVGEAERR